MNVAAAAPKPMTLSGMIRDLDEEHPEWTDQQVALAILEELDIAEPALAILLPAVANYACSVKRARPRRLERKLDANWKPGQVGRGRRDAVSNFRIQLAEYADEYVKVPGVGQVLVADVTLDQWEIIDANTIAKRDGLDRRHVFQQKIMRELHNAKVATVRAYREKEGF